MNANTKPTTLSLFRTIAILLTITVLMPISGYSQADSLKKYKNTIRFNLTNPMIFATGFYILGYERVINDHQTFSVGMGRAMFPKFLENSLDSLGIAYQSNNWGLNLSFDYRFYLSHENKYNAPRGIYIGPYYGFNYFSRELSWDLKTADYTGKVNTKMELMANLVGVQMGYQFVFWNRMTVDLIMAGPGVWFLNMKTNFDTSLPADQQTMLLEKLNQMVKDRFPASNLVISGDGFEAKKVTHTSAMGFRYMINLGFRF